MRVTMIARNGKALDRVLRVLLAFVLAMLVCMPANVAAAWAQGIADDGAYISALSADDSSGGSASDQEDDADDGSSSKDDSDADDGSDSGKDDPEPEKNYVKELFLKWSSDYGGQDEFVGKGQPIKKVQIEDKGQLVQLNTYYLDNSGSGVMEQAADSSTDLGTIDITFKSSDTKVATVSPSGLVTPVKNGSCTITASVKNPDKYGEASVSVDFKISGQNGNYVSDVQITDKKGKEITGTVVLSGDGAKPVYYQLYATITWSDANGKKVKTEKTSAKKCSASYSWATAGNTEVVSINKTTGRMASQQSGIGQVMITVAGGKAGKTVSDTIYVRVDTGQYDYNPADSLTLKVSYEKYPDKYVTTKTYSAKKLAKLLSGSVQTNNYTVIGGNGYATIRATGYQFIDVLRLLNCDIDDIKQFRFGTQDSYDSPVSYEYLFGQTRYWFPNYDIGSTAEAVVVPPLLATANSMHWNESYISPDEKLDESTRFRLVFGVSGTADSNTSKQIYYINTINIVLKGAPPASDGDGDSKGDDSGNGNGGSGGGSGGSGNGGSGTGAGPGPSDSSSGGTAGKGDDAAAGTKWRVYQIMSDAKSTPGTLDLENPLAPFAAPAAGAAFVLGGLYFYLDFRRRRVS